MFFFVWNLIENFILILISLKTMSNNKFNSSLKTKDTNDYTIDDMSSTKGMFYNSFKRSNTKKWNINQNPEEVKIGKLIFNIKKILE